MSSPRPPREKKGREAAASRGWLRFRRERRAGAPFFGKTEVVHPTKMSCCLVAFSSSQAGGSRDLVAAREGRANATRRRARGRRASSRCSITQSARLPSARRRSRRPRRLPSAQEARDQHKPEEHARNTRSARSTAKPSCEKGLLPKAARSAKKRTVAAISACALTRGRARRGSAESLDRSAPI